MRLFSIGLGFLLIAGLMAAPAQAQDTALYEGEADVTDQSEAQRQAALPRALAQVLVKVTGEADAAGDPGLADALSGAAQMMQQYRYRQDVVTASGTPELKLTLIARFNAEAVERLVVDAGRTVWPAPRPRPLLWLAIDDGRGARLVGEAQASAVAPLSRRASQRGYALAFPKADLQDQTLGGAAAVWREDVAAVQRAAQRYGASPVLLGKMQRGAAGWESTWRLVEAGATVQRWTMTHADAATVLAAGADGAATAMAQDYANRILSGPAGDYRIAVEGVAAAQDYARVLKYLQGLPIVREVHVEEAAANRLQLTLGLRTGVEGLKRLAQGGGVLVPPADAAEPLVFRLRH
ncbi:MAG: DUF2066 domain-containing protein [Chiayiivirga sp.]|uniref:DUF2066 domain-containing protein n=1 Tax=Chiayiivirga sp. TaxID=2041042 RepID=UPI0025BD9278|nr:DUF2066 domain-containing protein [Chiayiivirga sp.]MCI1709049.1 DUF2066 domain-containing protein [Chiayiivirga sp.]MCI1729336.1 DUF2066 domain-containing protein [Chiayiivirga sp.]